MKFRFRKIWSLLLIGALLLPSLAKLEHHHNFLICNAKDVKHFHVQDEKCYICSFEFSVFSFDHRPQSGTKVDFSVFIENTYQSFTSLNHPAYIFLLRAPPVNTKISA